MRGEAAPASRSRVAAALGIVSAGGIDAVDVVVPDFTAASCSSVTARSATWPASIPASRGSRGTRARSIASARCAARHGIHPHARVGRSPVAGHPRPAPCNESRSSTLRSKPGMLPGPKSVTERSVVGAESFHGVRRRRPAHTLGCLPRLAFDSHGRGAGGPVAVAAARAVPTSTPPGSPRPWSSRGTRATGRWNASARVVTMRQAAARLRPSCRDLGPLLHEL